MGQDWIKDEQIANQVRQSWSNARHREAEKQARLDEFHKKATEEAERQAKVKVRTDKQAELGRLLDESEVKRRLDEIAHEFHGGILVEKTGTYVGYGQRYWRAWTSQGLVLIERDDNGNFQTVRASGIGVGSVYEESGKESQTTFYLSLGHGEIIKSTPQLSKARSILSLFKKFEIKPIYHAHGDFVGHHGAEQAIDNDSTIADNFLMDPKSAAISNIRVSGNTQRNRHTVLNLLREGLHSVTGGHH
jgi:hypothetical protein